MSKLLPKLLEIGERDRSMVLDLTVAFDSGDQHSAVAVAFQRLRAPSRRPSQFL